MTAARVSGGPGVISSSAPGGPASHLDARAAKSDPVTMAPEMAEVQRFSHHLPRVVINQGVIMGVADEVAKKG